MQCKHPTCGEFCRRVKKKTIRKPIRQVSKKRARTFKEKKVVRDKDHLLYLEIWEERPHICENCGCYLGEEPLTIYFDHTLEKSKYPKLRHEKKNIMLLCWKDHSLKTNGFPPIKVKQRITKIYEKFGK